MINQKNRNQATAISLREMNARHPYLSYSWWTKLENQKSQPVHHKIGGKKHFYMEDVLAWEQSRGKYRSLIELKHAGGSLQ